MRLTRSFAMPSVDCRLQRCADLEQFGVARREVVDQRRQALPEMLRIDAGCW